MAYCLLGVLFSEVEDNNALEFFIKAFQGVTILEAS